MALGNAGRFFAPLALFVRQRVPLQEALTLMGARFEPGASLADSLPPTLSRDLVPLVAEMEAGGLSVEDLEALAAWPDADATGIEPAVARIFAHASILIRRGMPLAETFGTVGRPGDPAPLGAALAELSQVGAAGSFSDAMERHPAVFSAPVRRLVRQMEFNGSADAAFREIARGIAEGWFPCGDAEPGGVLGILEDDVEGRQPRFREAAAALGIRSVLHDNAPDFVAWLEKSFDSIRLLSLDHDLGPSRARDGARFEPGVGMHVVDALLKRKPSFPVLVHSSNPYDAPTMVRRLAEAGWTTRRIVPWGDDWISTVWHDAARQSLGPGGVIQP